MFEFEGCGGEWVEVEVGVVGGDGVVGNELGVEVCLDEGEWVGMCYGSYGGSEEWKENVLWNEGIVGLKFGLGGNERDGISVEGLDEGVVLEEVYVYRVGN